MKFIVTFLIGALVGAGAVCGYMQLTQVEGQSSAMIYTPHQVVFGSLKAPVIVYEYSSVGCGACAHFRKDTWPKIKESYVDKGRTGWVLRPFPLGSHDLKASMLAFCSKNPEKVLHAFYGSQERWFEAKDPHEEMKKIAKEQGLLEEEIEACLKNEKLIDEFIAGRIRAGEIHHVEATPTFVIGNATFSGAIPPEELMEILDKAQAHVKSGKDIKDFTLPERKPDPQPEVAPGKDVPKTKQPESGPDAQKEVAAAAAAGQEKAVLG